MIDYAKMTIRQLEASACKLSERRAGLREEQRKINAEIAKKNAKGGK